MGNELDLFGNVLRRDGLENQVVNEKVEERRSTE